MADITYSSTDVSGGQTGVGLRWVLGVSLVAVVLAFTIVSGAAIAG